MATVIDDVTHGFRRTLIIRVFAFVIILPLVFCFLCIPIWAVTQHDLKPWILVLSAGLFLFLIFAGMAVYIGVVLFKRNQMLDSIFSPLGLQGKAYMIFFRQYHGKWAGRQIDVYLSRGPRLEIELSTSLNTRLGVTGQHTDTRFFSELANRTPLDTDNPALKDLLIYPFDMEWTRQLLSDPQVGILLQQLTSLTSTFTRQQIILRPGAFQLLMTGNIRMLTFSLERNQTYQRIEDLYHLANIAERVPAPQMIAELSSLEKTSLAIRYQNPYLTLWIGLVTFASILIGSLCIAGIIILLVTVE